MLVQRGPWTLNLNHINLPVPDVAATRDFFVKHFGMVSVFELPKNSLVILRDEAGLVLNLSHFDKTSVIEYHKDFHIGFFRATREEIDAIHSQLNTSGVIAESPKKAVGRYGFFIDAPGGFMIEVASLEGEAWASRSKQDG
ncbi:VOC family protein [Telmatocola sphagniphila]|uniref:VOC family protein n=1 Tax=Telmatocola sphagniphila TaxID=1123043 RepID=A0A8E6B957_9BACT|nr:VOC family protein [Telmatocola sphagniphila]QVL34051.1 VOC family protein [Telmatocola sphagniphila]